MTNFATKISGVAMLVLAALPIASLPAAAFAQTSVRISDIDLLTPQGMATFKTRAQVAASRYCGDIYSLTARAHCRIAVKAELNDKVAVIRAARLEQASKALAAR
ncbi:MAG TPA: UrcA family protein [Phenylobacterium sp.]